MGDAVHPRQDRKGETMIIATWMLVLAAGVAPAAAASPTASDAAALTALLNEFLAGASRNDVATHERFWANDLVYVRSAGRLTTKDEILSGLRGRPATSSDEPPTTYTSEDVHIRQYGDTAVVNFRLVGAAAREGRRETTRYLNTGVFRKAAGRWQAVSWQATRVPFTAEEAREGVLAAEAAMRRALVAGDAKALEQILDEGYVWTRGSGEPVTRAHILEVVRSGRQGYARIDASDLAVSVYGDTAVVRGSLDAQPAPAAGGAAPEPLNASFTLTLGNRGEGWKVLAMHTSRRAN